MVDFNNEATITTPAQDIVRVIILQRRNDLLEALESYNKLSFRGVSADISTVKSRLRSLYYELEHLLKRQLKTPDYEDLEKHIESDKDEDIVKAVRTINQVLDKVQLIKIDNKANIDRTLAENENKLFSI